jgi:hypothetical protein
MTVNSTSSQLKKKARQVQLAAIQKYRDDCTAAGDVIQGIFVTRYWVDKYGKRHYYRAPTVTCVVPS